MSKSKWSDMTDEQKQRHLEWNAKKRAERAGWSDDRKAKYRERAKERRAERLASMTEAERTALQKRQYEKVKARSQKYGRTGKGYFFKWANVIKTRAAKKGIPFDIDADYLMSIMPTNCPILGVELVRGSDRYAGPFSPTVDRIVPAKGYVRGNVMIISKRANQIKSDATAEEVMKVALFLANS